jgi:hypothetical protein
MEAKYSAIYSSFLTGREKYYNNKRHCNTLDDSTVLFNIRNEKKKHTHTQTTTTKVREILRQ